MKKILSLALVGLALNVSLIAMSAWTPVAKKLHDAVVFITDVDGSCSGFMIDTKKHLVLTAAHCDGEKLLVDGTQAVKVYKDERKDLLVLRAYSVDRPALALAKTAPDLGDEVASMGFGFGLERPMFRIAHVSTINMNIEDLSGPFLVLDAQFIPGQSGGPVVNQAGEVISIVQRTGDGWGFGIPFETIKDKVERYFEK